MTPIFFIHVFLSLFLSIYIYREREREKTCIKIIGVIIVIILLFYSPKFHVNNSSSGTLKHRTSFSYLSLY
jgi:hypothetical protein